MRFFFRHIWHELWNDDPSRWLLLATIALNVSHWALFLVNVPRGDQFVPLHYTIYFGIDLTSHWTRLFVMPAIGTLLLIVHVFTTRIVADPTWRRTWLLVGLVTNVLLVGAGVAIVRIIQSSL